ncbi:SDR family NAD(P)-dependent oxidoreductase [Streptomyces sp. NPDC050560]|uniref:SDR family NAD(P)-dependent oxidoreductase n=1 Tax=Streptomyces sp. NPDC050560 TaxID=3365630 RepID=UPI0037A71810
MTDLQGKPLAVVTGASSGIGRELAKEFADHGFDLVVAAEDYRIEDAGDEVRAHGADVLTVRADLATRRGLDRLTAALFAGARPVAAAALNAGVGQGGSFVHTDLADEERIIDLNVTSTVALAKNLLPAMVERGTGRVLFTSSLAATMPGAYQAVYNASKSFVQSFAEALMTELEGTGVTVTSLMPGATDTEFFERADMLDTRLGSGDKDDPGLVARQGFEAMMAGRPRVVAGSPGTKAQELANKGLPDRAKSRLHGRMAEPGSAGD